jgi:hypothetical protein
MEYEFSSKVWVYPSIKASWYFISVPVNMSEEIKASNYLYKRGFGSLKTSAKIHNMEWDTSIFPDSKTNSYLLPIKKLVRDTCGIKDGDTVSIVLKLPC